MNAIHIRTSFSKSISNKKYIFLLFLFFVLCIVNTAQASSTDGTIDAVNNTARGVTSGTGSFNFGTTAGNVHVTDSRLTGYVWSDYYGWINLAPTGQGVTNDGEGNLSGYAWGQNSGWINFNPVSSGVRVRINSSGDFIGYAWGQNIGWIVFNCDTNNSCGSGSFKVSTDWRPASTRSTNDSGGRSGGGIGGGNPGGGDTGTIGDIGGGNGDGGGNGGGDTGGGNPGGGDTGTIGDIGGGNGDGGGNGGGDNGGGDINGGTGGRGGGGGTGIIDNVTFIAQQITTEIITVALQVIKDISIASEKTYQATKRVVQSPTGSVVTKTVSTVGVVGGGVAVASTVLVNPFAWSDVLLIPFRLWGLLLATFNLKRRSHRWGIVYDSVTKQPLDPAYVSLQDLQGKEIASSITDLDGRYGFLLKNGVYKIVANKTNYIFPSQRLAGKSRDELYDNLYFGGEIIVTNPSDVVTKNIPLDPEGFDWNEFAKSQTLVMHFYSKRDRIKKRITDALFYVGFIFAFISLLFVSQPYNMAIFGLYIVLLLLRIFGTGQKSFGKIIEKSTGLPLSFAIVRIYLADIKQELTHKIVNKIGNYYALVPAGKYYVTIEKKNPDESYTLIYTSNIIDAREGIIKENFEV